MAYRDYESPYGLEMMIQDVDLEIHKAEDRGADEYEMYDLYEKKHELEDRLRFAWEDQEADTYGWN